MMISEIPEPEPLFGNMLEAAFGRMSIPEPEQPISESKAESISESKPGSESISEPISMRLEAVERILGHRFEDRRILLQALTHPSAVEESAIQRSYERLEFLGDSYLGAIVAEMLYRRFPNLDEGGMTRAKISLVSGESLSRKAYELGIGELIIFGSSEHGTGQRGLRSALENVFEALVAALVLDAGFAYTQSWVTQTFSEEISQSMTDKPDNPKSNLQELFQVKHITPTYELISADGPAHERTFTCRVMANGAELATGVGRSKKAAESDAAANALALTSGQSGERSGDTLD